MENAADLGELRRRDDAAICSLVEQALDAVRTLSPDQQDLLAVEMMERAHGLTQPPAKLSAEERVQFVVRLGRDEALRQQVIAMEQLLVGVSRLPRPTVPDGFVAASTARTR